MVGGFSGGGIPVGLRNAHAGGNVAGVPVA